MEDFLHGVWHIVQEYYLLIMTVVMTILMAIFRTAKANGKVDWLEAGMCGIFAYGIWFVLGFFSLPEGAGVLIGGMIGFKGTTLVSAWIANKVGISVDKEDKKDEQ